jgi:hypothetical protein
MTRTEYALYTREQLEKMAKFNAMLALVGSYYEGNITTQSCQWKDDGSVEVLTHHVPSPK